MMTHIRAWRESANLKTREAAERIGVTNAMWSRWETGSRKVPATRVAAISSLTGIPPHLIRPDVFPEPF